MHLQFHGAADGVTGSLHRVTVGDRDVLLDCGLFQGHRQDAFKRNRQLPDWAARAECVLLSHAHLDHSGNLPSLVKAGFRGNVFCTPSTRDLCSVMLRDAALIQQQDVAYINRRNQREGLEERVEPLYSVEDAQQAINQIVSLPYRRSLQVAPGVTVTFHNSGHVLGSSLVQLDLMENGRRARLLFTGDLGRKELPLLKDPELVEDVDHLLIESTYGDRSHPSVEGLDEQLAEIIRETIERGGRVYIPSFALERAQEVLFALERLHERDAVPRVPIYIDSPLTIAITEIYKLHPEALNEKVRARILSRDCPFSPPELHYISDSAESKALMRRDEPCVIIAGSGMCEGGRIVHHFTRALGDARNSVVIVGFMAQHTLGRRLTEGRRKVRVLGVERELLARVHVLGGLSAHADREELLDYVRRTKRLGNLRKVLIVHGEDTAKRTLAEAVEGLSELEVIRAEPGSRVAL